MVLDGLVTIGVKGTDSGKFGGICLIIEDVAGK